MSASAARMSELSIGSFLLRFYSSRVKRILPALLLCLTVTTVLSTLFIPSAWLSGGYFKVGFFAFFGLSNVALSQMDNYFSPRAEFNPYTHTWSLGVEEQFYFLFPFIFYASLKLPRQLRLSPFIIGFIISMATAILLAKTNGTAAFYSIFSRFWELGSGIILYQMISNRTLSLNLSKRALNLGSLFSLTLIFWTFFNSNPDNFPAPGAIPAVLGTLGFLYFTCSGSINTFASGWLSNASLVFVGLMSYSLYLWHWPVFVLMKWTLGLEKLSHIALALIATTLLATFSYFFVERPIRNSKLALQMPRYAVVIAGLTFVLISSYVSSLIDQNKRYLSLSTVEKNSEYWHQSFPGEIDANCRVVQNRSSLTHGDFTSIQRVCGEMPAMEIRRPQLFAIGDSHLVSYRKMLENLAQQTDTIVYLYSNGGCPFARLLYPTQDQCKAYESSALTDILARARKDDLLFLPSLRLPRFGDQWVSFGEEQFLKDLNSEEALQKRLLAEEETVEKLAPFISAGIVVIFEAPKPIFRSPAFRCSDWFNASNPICKDGLSIKRKDLESYRAPVFKSFYKLQKKFPSIQIWDPLPILCPQSNCRVAMDQKPLFTDGDHISGYANDLLFDDFRSTVENPSKTSLGRR